MHALWSLGGLLSGAAATAAASAGADMRVWLALIGIAAVLITIVGRRLIGGYASPRRVADSDADSAVDSGIENESDSRGDDPSGSPAARGNRGGDGAAGRSKRAILLAALPLASWRSAAAVEDIANNWAGLAAVEFANVPAASAGIAFSIVIGSQCLGRFSGDVLVTRFGAGRVARLGGGLIALGGIGAITAQEPILLLISMGAFGFGSQPRARRTRAAGRLPVSDGPGSDSRELADAGRLPGTSPLAVGSPPEPDCAGDGILVLVGILTMVFANRLNVRRT